MIDLLLDGGGDLYVTPNGDVSLTESVIQAVEIRLRWVLGEWRLNPGFGVPMFEGVLVKNPELEKVKSLFRNEVMSVDGVKDCEIKSTSFDPRARTIHISFRFSVGEDCYEKEMQLNV